MSWLRTMTRLAEPADGRVPPVFRPYHVAVALVMIGREQPLGRYEMCENMSIGEGSVRTLIKRLTEEGFTEADGKQGQRLTQKGLALFKAITADIPMGLFLDLRGLVLYKKAYANLVRGRAKHVTNGIRQRDEAIVHGGLDSAGATTLVYRNGLLVMPPDDFQVLRVYERQTLLLLDSLKPEDGDAVVIGTSDDPNVAREVSMAAAMTLFRDDR
ncbi:MAG: DUF4443 domain-containing protein [Candidatus Thorarchaeota archaeon]|nr:DUF4443 domain-containing protein [Candidatus Thorarchaeota archaeon]